MLNYKNLILAHSVKAQARIFLFHSNTLMVDEGGETNGNRSNWFCTCIKRAVQRYLDSTCVQSFFLLIYIPCGSTFSGCVWSEVTGVFSKMERKHNVQNIQIFRSNLNF